MTNGRREIEQENRSHERARLRVTKEKNFEVCAETFRCEKVPQDKNRRLAGLEIRLLERSEFPHFPVSRRILS